MLKPLELSDRKKNREKLPKLVPQWEAEIRSLELSEHDTKELTELLIYAVLQRFQKLTLKERPMTPAADDICTDENPGIGMKCRNGRPPSNDLGKL